MKKRFFNKYKSKGIFLLLFVFNNCCLAQTVLLDAKICKAKLEEKTRLLKNITTTLKLPITDSTYLQYESTFWAMMYLEQKPIAALPKLKFALKNFIQYDDDFRNGLLEVVYSQYPKELEKEISILIKDTSITAKQFAICGEYLFRVNKKYSKILKSLLDLNFKKKYFKNNSTDFLYYNALQAKIYEINEIKSDKSMIIKILLENSFLKNKSVIISLQNKNRNYPGLALIRDSTGKIVLKNDTFFYVQQLARAVTNLPYYISNGNTPQGIFRISGFGVSKNNSIGPTGNFQLCMPYECNVKDFIDETLIDTNWSQENYQKIYPQNLEFLDDNFIQTEIAGKLGRFEIISHGTTVNNEYYKGKPYYGFTPTAGCLQAKEIWDYTTGKRLYSDQQKLIDAYKSIGAIKGYLIVLDIIDANRPVNINDFKAMLK